ncbi:MAG: metallophosphoesterase [Gammaproteobacteria bacterium]|nr:metallophosphoesterase [Gammaproteobacteria bacterium]NIM72831.1 metallophosphoesterase [Gammaproteobacteria bacterium]NIN38289.1 metallophosphoesterase [Gammaproteobacteria bacterium]NIO24579.1 metallophosphoesterase [Gammaproteobacteria bacterium]NIO65188.1 metallophosphoesterase [Gammaproteobacteria bacterium]
MHQRLGIEDDAEALVFGQGRTFFHIENWRFAHSVMRVILTLIGLRGRARRNALSIEVRHNEIPVPGLPTRFDGFRLLHLSDMHLDTHADFAHALIERLQGLEYDVAVMTGDFRAQTFGPIDLTVDAMTQLRPHLKSPIYAVLGNHDSLRMVPHFENIGIRVLLNESVEIDHGGETIYLAGIDDPHYFRADNMEKAAEGIAPDTVSVLLAHSPEIYRQAAHAGFSVMLCGHTHGGQICLPGGIPLIVNARCPRRYCKGAWRYRDLAGYTSVGSGVSMVDARLNCPPEITLHRLRPA